MDTNSTLSTLMTEDWDDLPTFNIQIPDPLTCLPERTHFVPGRNHSHPSHSSLVVDPPMARSITDQDWGAGAVVRSVEPKCSVTFHKRQATFAGFSVKSGRMISGTGPHELAAFKRLETDHTTVDYDFENLEITWHSAGKEFSYTPDYTRVTDIGSVETAEIKADASHFMPEDYHLKLEAGGNALAEVKIEFRLITGRELRGDPRFQFNVSRAFGDRFTLVAPSLRDAVANQLAKANGPVGLGAIEEVLDKDPHVARARAHSLLCKRDIAFELTGVITRDTPVSLPRHPELIPDIRAIGHEGDNS
jgi:hypothetical protein